MMMLNSGDYVFSTDLPRRFLCRVEAAETIGLEGGAFQILKLVPLEGPWTPSTRLIRTSSSVLVPQRRDMWRWNALMRPASVHRVVRQRGRHARRAG